VLPGLENDSNEKMEDDGQSSLRAVNKSFEYLGEEEDSNLPTTTIVITNQNSPPSLNITNVKNSLKREISTK
jgi:hypothetical protein